MPIPAKLSKYLLFQMMVRLGHLRTEYPLMVLASNFIDLVPQSLLDLGSQRRELVEAEATLYVARHAKFLEEEGYLTLGDLVADGDVRIASITSLGEKFLQPELAEFGNRSMLPDIINALEERLDHAVTIDQEDRSSMKVKLRKALVVQSVATVRAIIVEIITRIATQ